MSVYSWLKPKGPSGFGYGSTAEQVTAGLSLAGKTVIVTGCNSGIGFETMRVLALRGAHVIGTGRSEERARAACARVKGAATAFACDLADPASVRGFVAAIKALGAPIDAIICNAGIMALPELTLTYGYELQFFTNHIGHFILVTGLLDQLTANGRVVMVSSTAHTRAPEGGIQFDNLSGQQGYSAFTSYGQSKFANLLFAKELARRFAGTAKTANAVHPGVIRTNIIRHVPATWLVDLIFGIATLVGLKTVPQGAATQCYAAVHPDAAAISGAYLRDSNVAEPRADANDPALAAKLWEVSEKIVAGLP